jgi:hypothetical protein
MKKLYQFITSAIFMTSTSLIANPTAVCSGPTIVQDTSGNGLATASYTVRRSYDFQDHDLSNATISWSASSSSPNHPCKVLSFASPEWDANAKFTVNQYFPVTCTITATITDNSVSSTCTKNVFVEPQCDFSDPFSNC